MSSFPPSIPDHKPKSKSKHRVRTARSKYRIYQVPKLPTYTTPGSQSHGSRIKQDRTQLTLHEQAPPAANAVDDFPDAHRYVTLVSCSL